MLITCALDIDDAQFQFLRCEVLGKILMNDLVGQFLDSIAGRTALRAVEIIRDDFVPVVATSDPCDVPIADVDVLRITTTVKLTATKINKVTVIIDLIFISVSPKLYNCY